MLPLEHLNKRGCSPTKLTLERKMKIFVTAMFDHGSSQLDLTGKLR